MGWFCVFGIILFMEGFKIGLITGLLLGCLLFVGYLGLDKLQGGDEYVDSDESSELVLGDEGSTNLDFENSITPAPAEVVENPATDTNEVITTSVPNKHAELATALQKLIDDKVLMDSGSRGTRVGTLQQFLNVYTGKTGGVDNDYGPGTKEKVRAFQRDQGLTADGQAGPTTYKKMIDYLNTL